MVVVLDCNDVERLADSWSAALGFPTRHVVEQFVVLRPAEGDSRPHLILQRVPEGKTGKNRSHLDLRFRIATLLGTACSESAQACGRRSRTASAPIAGT